MSTNYYVDDCEILRFPNERKLDFTVTTFENIVFLKPIINANKRVKVLYIPWILRINLSKPTNLKDE